MLLIRLTSIGVLGPIIWLELLRDNLANWHRNAGMLTVLTSYDPVAHADLCESAFLVAIFSSFSGDAIVTLETKSASFPPAAEC